MDIQTNYIVCAALLIGAFIFVVIAIVRNSKKDDAALRKEYRTIWDVVDMIKDYMVEMLSADISEDVTDEEFDRLYRRVAKIRTANKNATFGMDAAKSLIKDIIAEAISQELLDQEIDNILGMGAGQIPSVHCQFEAIMQHYKLLYSKTALAHWIDENKFDLPHSVDGHDRYYISIKDVTDSYQKVIVDSGNQLSRKEKIKLLSTLVYQLYRGFGIIDTVREMNIDGLNIGTSGSILSNLEGNTIQMDPLKPEQEAVRGCWLYYKGKYIHLRFMNFGTADEIKRIVNLLVRYNSSGTLTAKRGYMVNTMYDKSRLLAFRPPVAEYYAAFIRKFTLGSITVERLVCKENVTNGPLARDMLKFLMQGLITCIITGRQGTGKTTLMSAMIDYVNPIYNIRVLEMAPELYLRELYKDRNILSAQETQHVSASEIQNAFKKSDSAMSICGEIANDELCARFMEFGRVASIQNLATHHANTTRDLVLALRNSLINAGGLTSAEAAEQQVIEVVKIDVHLELTRDGFRYIDRISEIVQVDSEPYKTFTEEVPKREDFDTTEKYELALREHEVKLQDYEAKLKREYYTRCTDRENFAVNQLLHFDLASKTYIADNPPTALLQERMKRNMTENQIQEFEVYIQENYEIPNAQEMPIQELSIVSAANENTNKYLDKGDDGRADSVLGDALSLLSKEAKSNEDDMYLTEATVDMDEAIGAIRHKGGTNNIVENFSYTPPKTNDDGFLEDFAGDVIDNCVQIEAEEDARKQAELYAPMSEEQLNSMLEAESKDTEVKFSDEVVDITDAKVEEGVSTGKIIDEDVQTEVSDVFNALKDIKKND